MSDPQLEICMTEHKGRGVFTREPIQRGRKVLTFQGRVLTTAELTEDLLAMQIDHDLWLCSDGALLDDCVNHSCEPNCGFVEGDLTLFALRSIQPNEEITWDYSTSISEPDWTLDCRCGAATCRGLVQAWGCLDASDRALLRPIALKYLRTAPT